MTKSAIEKMEMWWRNQEDWGKVQAIDVMTEIRRLAAEEAKEKPTPPASLVEELKAWIKDSVLNGYATTTGAHQLLDIILRYRPEYTHADFLKEWEKLHPSPQTDIVGVSWDKIDKLLEYILDMDVRPVNIRTVKAIVGYASRHTKEGGV